MEDLPLSVSSFGELHRVAAVLLERLEVAEVLRLVAGRRGGRADKIDRDAARAHAPDAVDMCTTSGRASAARRRAVP